MTQAQTVTLEYLEGIKDGRAMLRCQPDMTAQDIEGLLENCTTLLKMGFAQPMRDMYRGERDFWKQQLKIGRQPLSKKRHDHNGRGTTPNGPSR